MGVISARALADLDGSILRHESARVTRFDLQFCYQRYDRPRSVARQNVPLLEHFASLLCSIVFWTGTP